uniref:Uncharacterized protein n=1 Tax=Cannabis sativa TaxID=3483 RepID=A0A803Q7Z5_CANSA
MVEFLNQEDGFIKLEEAVQCVDTVAHKKMPTKYLLDRAPGQNQQYPSSSTSSGKRSNNVGRQGSKKKGKFTGNA